MRKALFALVCLLSMTAAGTGLEAQEVTVTLIPGWTWISCPSTEAVGFAEALGDFIPMQGDVIKSQWGSATYRGGQWRGTVSQFNPGYGYHYYSNREMPVTLTFNAQQPAPQVVVTTSEPMLITSISAMGGGAVTVSDGTYILVKGLCWATHENPTTNDDFFEEAESGVGSFSILMTGLNISTTYYVRAYAVTPNGTVYGNQESFTTLDIPVGAINGLFSVSASQQVYFSQGNLQYQASTNTWRFAESQYETCDWGEMQYYIWDDVLGDYVNVSIEEYNAYIEQGCGDFYSIYNVSMQYTAFYSGWIDLFGWGTSGYNHGANCYQPWSTSIDYSDYYAYGNYQYNLYDQTGQADWGYNPISNGGNQTNQWRTLSQPEWNYVFNTRSTTSGIRYVKANVNDVNGVILLPDDWISSTYSLSNTNTYNASFSSNTLTASQWSILEQAGAVFLPAAGTRDGTSVYGIGSDGSYWSASFCYSGSAFGVLFYDSSLGTYGGNRCRGRSVRLVCPAEN